MQNICSLRHLLLLLLACLPLGAKDADVSGTAGESRKAVRVFSKREGSRTKIFVENQEYCEITMTFDMRLVNLKSNVELPLTAVIPARGTTEAFWLEPVDENERWEYSYTNSYKLGSNLAQHDESFVYQLPYAPGKRFVVTQAYNGAYSHKGSNQYAIDWKMPEGTLVYAARGGIVVKTKDDSNSGGASMKFDKFNNFVLIRHDDGTLGHYCHLQQSSCLVMPGQTVTAGQAIARSGNTGFSSGPHLHLCVFRTIDGRDRESIPVKFRTAEATAVTLQEDKRYAATKSVSTLAEVRNGRTVGAATP